MTVAESSMRKMFFELEGDDDGWPDFKYESLWVEALSGERYRVMNIPCYAQDVAPDDIVTGKTVNQMLLFERVVEPSDNSVFMGVCRQDGAMAKVKEWARRHGIRMEVGSDRLFSLACNRRQLIATKAALRKLEGQDVLGYAENCLR